MIRKDIKSTKIYNEFSSEMAKEFFAYSDKKFLPHLDTLYFSCFIKDDCVSTKDNNSIDEFIFNLQSYKDTVIANNEEVYYENFSDLLVKRRRFKIYDFCLSVNNMYDIFITSHLPNTHFQHSTLTSLN